MKIYLLILLTAFISACERPAPTHSEIREMFDAQNKRVITSFANRKEHSLSVLFGNDAARKCARSGYGVHRSGEIFELVIFNQADNKYWYGSYINGAIKSVELVYSGHSAGDSFPLRYRLAQGVTPKDSLGRTFNAEQRISSILSHNPSVYPKVPVISK